MIDDGKARGRDGAHKHSVEGQHADKTFQSFNAVEGLLGKGWEGGPAIDPHTSSPRRKDKVSISAEEECLLFSPHLPPLPPDQTFGGLGDLGGANPRMDEISFRKKLMLFAKRSAIPISVDGAWYYRAIRIAAGEHPELDIRKKQRGRPSLPRSPSALASMLGTQSLRGKTSEEEEAEQWIVDIDEYNAQLEGRQRKLSDRRAARILAEEEDGEDRPNLVEDTAARWRRRLAAARKALGRQKRPRNDRKK